MSSSSSFIEDLRCLFILGRSSGVEAIASLIKIGNVDIFVWRWSVKASFEVLLCYIWKPGTGDFCFGCEDHIGVTSTHLGEVFK